MTDDEFFAMSDDEKIAGSILGTAYFIERLTDEHHLENLLLLYNEFNTLGMEEHSDGKNITKKAV